MRLQKKSHRTEVKGSGSNNFSTPVYERTLLKKRMAVYSERKQMSSWCFLQLIFAAVSILWPPGEAMPSYRAYRGMVGHAVPGYSVAGPRNRLYGLVPLPMGRMGGIMMNRLGMYDDSPMATARIGSSMASAGGVAAGVSPEGIPWVTI